MRSERVAREVAGNLRQVTRIILSTGYWLRVTGYFLFIFCYNKTMLTSFQKRVLALTVKIPKGKVTTYGEIAKALGSSPRAVGQALGANPYLIKIPCHRVVESNGNLGGYSGGVKKKAILLRGEGIQIKNNKVIHFKKYFINLKTQISKLNLKSQKFLVLSCSFDI